MRERRTLIWPNGSAFHPSLPKVYAAVVRLENGSKGTKSIYSGDQAGWPRKSWPGGRDRMQTDKASET
ncbi:MAG: hypothetical protein ACRDFW_09010, partial [bacterium]